MSNVCTIHDHEIKDLGVHPTANFSPSNEIIEFIYNNFWGRCLNIGTGYGTSLDCMLDSNRISHVATMDLYDDYFHQNISNNEKLTLVDYCPFFTDNFDCVFIDDMSNRVMSLIHHYGQDSTKIILVDDWIAFSLSDNYLNYSEIPMILHAEGAYVMKDSSLL